MEKLSGSKGWPQWNNELEHSDYDDLTEREFELANELASKLRGTSYGERGLEIVIFCRENCLDQSKILSHLAKRAAAKRKSNQRRGTYGNNR